MFRNVPHRSRNIPLRAWDILLRISECTARKAGSGSLYFPVTIKQKTTQRFMNTNSVGTVKTEIIKINLPAEGFKPEKGGVLPELHVAFEKYGALSANKDNVILICHALSGDAHAAGFHEQEGNKQGWWDVMIGPGKGIDTNRFHVICSNILGGCKGTTGPSSINPETGRQYAADFPEITIGDMVRVQKLLLNELGIDRLFGVIGGSAGGLQVLDWCVRYPDTVANAVCIASAEHLSAQALSFDIIARNIIMADPKWNSGQYYDSEMPESGLSLARMIGHITYLSKESMDEKFGRERHDGQDKGIFDTDFQVERYLDHQGESFVERFDANSFLYITSAMDSFSISESGASFEEAFAGVKTKFMILSVSSDWLYPAEQSKELAGKLLRAGKTVTYCNLSSPYGHDAFLLENSDLSNLISSCFSGYDSLSCDGLLNDPDAERDYGIISRMIKRGSKVLDLGCGDGSVLCKAGLEGAFSGQGVDVDFNKIIESTKKNVPVFQMNIDEGLDMIPDNFYDYAILNRTLLEVHRPYLVLGEMIRVARTGIVSFTNFASWRHRLRLNIRGRMPVSKELPYSWYDTPNIHFLTLKDFRVFCNEKGIEILEITCIPDGIISRIFILIGLKNLGADRVIAGIKRKISQVG
ncbi:MAG: homoserine O-acetyltransferase [Spirochaetota bacterium]